MKESRAIVPVRSRPGAIARVILFPHAGGAASNYRWWAREFSDDIQLDLVEYSGRGARLNDPPVTDHKILVDEVVEAVVQKEQCTALLGHSMGSLIAYETARALSSMGMPPEHLFVSASRAPSQRIPLADHSLTDEALIADLVRYGGTPMEFLEDRDLRNLLLGTLRNDYRLLQRYVFAPGELLPVDITAFYGSEDRSVSDDEVSEWASMTDCTFASVPLGGGHFYNPSSIRQLCAIVERVMGSPKATGV